MHSSTLDSYRRQTLPFPRPMRSEPESGNNRPFFTRVESLRALAALAIAGYHISGCALHNVLLLPDVPWQGVGQAQNSLRKLALVLLPAHAALMVFFVVSGFVLRLSLEHGPQRWVAGSAKFFLGRAFRMYPVVMFAMTWTVLLSLCRAYPVALFKSPLTLPLFIKNLLLLDVSINGTLWALQVEMLMAPIIVLLYFVERKFGPRLLAGAAVAATVLAYVPSWAFWPPLSTNMFSFVLGMTIPTFGRQFVTGMSRRKATVWTLLSACVLLVTAPCFGLYSRNSAVLEAYAGALLVSLVAYRLDIRVLHGLDWKPLRLVGLSSGSYYVLHMSTVPLALAIAPALVPPTWSTGFPALTGVLVISVWLIALVPLALASFHLIEAKGVALGKRVAGLCRIDSAPPAQPPEQAWTTRRAAA